MDILIFLSPGLHKRRRCARILIFTCTALVSLLGGSWAEQTPTPPTTPSDTPFRTEGYFNGSAYALLRPVYSLTRHIGISFKTCSHGILLHQGPTSGDTVTGDAFDIRVLENGAVRLWIRNGLTEWAVHGGSMLVDSQWHDVDIYMRRGQLWMTVDGRSRVVVANQTFHSDILRANFSSSTSLSVGQGFVGCLSHGPQVDLATSRSDVNVVWGQCPLPEDTSICRDLQIDMCSWHPCGDHGKCETVGNTFTCSCYERYSGEHCEDDLGPLCQRPDVNHCSHGSTCIENENGDGLTCLCPPEVTGAMCNISRNVTAPCPPDNNPCVNNGTCFVVTSSTRGYECVCQEGFNGTTCLENIDDCANTPCMHDGRCIDGISNYTCDCAATGYEGSRCEHDLEDCSLSPSVCDNNGTCYERHGGFVCECGSGYEGRTCTSQVANPCSSSPCLNGATCSPLPPNGDPPTFFCTCPRGYQGDQCENSVPIYSGSTVPCEGDNCVISERVSISCTTNGDTNCTESLDCSRFTCNHGGTCIDDENGVHCVCVSGYTGETCQNTSNAPCTPNPCSNNGSCVQTTDGSFTCSCVAGFTGRTCTEIVRACESSPCVNSGTCVDMRGGLFRCSCTTDFTGARCETALGECASHPCLNGGTCQLMNNGTFYCNCPKGVDGLTCENDHDDCVAVVCPAGKRCVDLPGSFQCQCPDGMTGDNCTENIDECESSPCINGTCTDGLNGYTCTCAPGFTGANCGEDIDECEQRTDPCNNGICKNEAGGYQCYCRPGFSGSNCELEFDECLSHPCKNGANCTNLVNGYSCSCIPGFQGKDCDDNINECLSSPCHHGGTCVDGINQFSCTCSDGYTGDVCENDINECASSPCLNNGTCTDSIAHFQCNCTNTGYRGINCEENINECESNPCMNAESCNDLINDYTCVCLPGWMGKNCETDINECISSPCQNGGSCYQLSDRNLYNGNPLGLTVFNRTYPHGGIPGFICVCQPGTEGDMCEMNRDDCVDNQCVYGTCIDGLNLYTCTCSKGYEGNRCEMMIKYCERYNPCAQGECKNLVGDYECTCPAGLGGKNCSVTLTGCEEVTCLNGATCLPLLVNETEHSKQCICPRGFHGDLCQEVTTLSLNSSSYVVVMSARNDTHDLHFRFRTTLPNGVLAIGQGSTYYSVTINEGRLNVQSSMLNIWGGVFLGEQLNNGDWQEVGLHINDVSVMVKLNDKEDSFPANGQQNTFQTVVIGGTTPHMSTLAKGIPFFVGCMEDVSVDDRTVVPKASYVSNSVHVEVGCPRQVQCTNATCFNGGKCTDLWRTFACKCQRPFIGKTCHLQTEQGTFHHESVNSSLAMVDIVDNTVRNTFNSPFSISLIIRTREEEGVIFYLGSHLSEVNGSFVAAWLEGGKLEVVVRFRSGAQMKTLPLSATNIKLNDGNYHLIEVNCSDSLYVLIDEQEVFQKKLIGRSPLNPSVMYLAGLPTPPYNTTLLAPHSLVTSALEDDQSFTYSLSSLSPPGERSRRQATSSPVSPTTIQPILPTAEAANSASAGVSPTVEDEGNLLQVLEGVLSFKGILQDVRLKAGKEELVVEFFPLNSSEVTLPPPLGHVTLTGVLKGEQTDDACAPLPCANNGVCHVTWNDFMCDCTRKYKGVTCHQLQYCQTLACPNGTECRDLDHGFECVANASFNGRNSSLEVTANFTNDNQMATMMQMLQFQIRTEVGGTVVYAVTDRTDQTTTATDTNSGQEYLLVQVFNSSISVTWNFDEGRIRGTSDFASGIVTDGQWHDVQINFTTTLLVGQIDNQMTSQLAEGPFADAFRGFVYRATIWIGTVQPSMTSLRGCLGEVRIGGILIPYVTIDEINAANNLNIEAKPRSNTAPDSFIVIERDFVEIGCTLCYNPECQNDAVCLDPPNSFDCHCVPGFFGQRCDGNIDECQSNQCIAEHTSTCLDGINNYTCGCLEGYAGHFCNEEVDECHENPCRNNGTCTDLINSYNCTCPSAYYGHNCENEKEKTCAENPCLHGTCLPDNTRRIHKYRCTCLPGYIGNECSARIDHCSSLPCENNGVCMLNTESFECQCAGGYNGIRCEINIDDCASTPCQNNGKCMDGNDTFTCNCTNTGYNGNICQDDIDECTDTSGVNSTNQYCVHSSNCTNTNGSFNCACDDGWCKPDCNTPAPCEAQSAYSATSVLAIVLPIIFALLIIGVIAASFFVMTARKKRATRGTYSPSNQEYCNPRLELDNVLKPPPEERLI